MLIEFTVENYKSFRDRTTLSMVAAKITSQDKDLDTNNVFDAGKNLRLLRSAAIYGANASGKSNLIAALAFMRHFVITSSMGSQINEPIPVEPFLLNTLTETKPSMFEIVFLDAGIEYRYGFECDRTKIISEWLYAQLSSRETELFVRHEQEFKIGPRFREGKGIGEKTRPNALFLSVVAQFNGSQTIRLLDWFFRPLISTGLQDEQFLNQFINATVNTHRDPDESSSIVELIKNFDLGIRGLGVIPSAEPLTKQDSLVVLHDVIDANQCVVDRKAFSLDSQESTGTRKLIALAFAVLGALSAGQLVVIDEFDARLHPLITRAIIKLFLSSETNPHNAQLIIATHDTNLLDKWLLRRDQIWFTEKDELGASHLTSLVEYRIRNDQSLEKNYFEGRYGAIPYLGDLSRLPEPVDA